MIRNAVGFYRLSVFHLVYEFYCMPESKSGNQERTIAEAQKFKLNYKFRKQHAKQLQVMTNYSSIHFQIHGILLSIPIFSQNVQCFNFRSDKPIVLCLRIFFMKTFFDKIMQNLSVQNIYNQTGQMTTMIMLCTILEIITALDLMWKWNDKKKPIRNFALMGFCTLIAFTNFEWDFENYFFEILQISMVDDI